MRYLLIVMFIFSIGCRTLKGWEKPIVDPCGVTELQGHNVELIENEEGDWEIIERGSRNPLLKKIEKDKYKLMRTIVYESPPSDTEYDYWGYTLVFEKGGTVTVEP